MANVPKSPAKPAPEGVNQETGEIIDNPPPSGSALEDAAREGGAVEVTAVAIPLPMELAAIPDERVSQLFPSPDAWSMYDQIDIDEMVDVESVIIDAMFFPSLTFDNAEWAIVLVMRLEDRVMLTYSNGGSVVLRKLHQLKETERRDGKVGFFPIRGKVTRHPSSQRGFHDYYDLI